MYQSVWCSLAREGKCTVGATAAGGPSWPHPSDCFIDRFDAVLLKGRRIVWPSGSILDRFDAVWLEDKHTAVAAAAGSRSG